MISTEAFWPKILQLEVQDILGHDFQTVDFLQLCPLKYKSLNKKINNDFWSQVFATIDPIMQGAIFSYPEKFMLSSWWDNPLILRNNRALRREDYPLLRSLNRVSNFYHPNSCRIKSTDKFEDSVRCVVDNDTYLEFLVILDMAKRKIGLLDCTSMINCLPQQPLLVHIANFVKKGCSAYIVF